MLAKVSYPLMAGYHSINVRLTDEDEATEIAIRERAKQMTEESNDEPPDDKLGAMGD